MLPFMGSAPLRVRAYQLDSWSRVLNLIELNAPTEHWIYVGLHTSVRRSTRVSRMLPSWRWVGEVQRKRDPYGAQPRSAFYSITIFLLSIVPPPGSTKITCLMTSTMHHFPPWLLGHREPLEFHPFQTFTDLELKLEASFQNDWRDHLVVAFV